ncbi:hypothetical protein K493DRAFT_43335 [Basidiobolus meristosporus CBS 931.73]|uniref:Uncharacterized protein n=1 Tax=Basidiobolus meristosporus CBS 931.73 TaxID=1314790 RepID=A0A1Y1Y396_9FUNG|nr:hypothetical protein K493DRAFT_43335 [Basidiobolus meristosporus CBS 931.73]|eukprot:ORX92470.1 hypothetical protein K493DRAFT_43335 [Basidiobolus meristosporus CBS 931.73]
MLQPDTPFINLEPCTPREFSDSDDELSESGQSFEMELTEFPGYSEVSSSQNTPQPSVKRFRSFSASKLAIPVKFSAEAQIRELEAKLVEKENEVLLAADIGQVLLKEIDSLKHKVAAYEHSKPADDLSQEIEINNTETVQKLRSFRVEAEIYTSSFKEKTPKIPGSPYTPGRRMDRSGTPGLLPINENDPDLTVLPPSALLPSKNSTSTLHSEISKAVESGENLMKLSRQLQTKLLDAERESLNLAERCSEQDRQIAALKIQVARGAENEAKSQENTWNLELQNQELQTQVDELEQVVQKVTSDQGRLQESLLVARETIDQLNLKEEKLNQTLERTKTRHEQEIIGIRKMIGNLQREKAELSKKNEELKLELSGRTQRAGGRPLGGSTPILEPAASGIDSPFELSDAFELPPARSPSPSPFSAPSSGQTLQVETLTGSLGHAHRTIANLRSSLHREKIEKMEMKKMLVESQETVEALQSEFMWESEDMDKVMKNVHRSVRKKMRRRKTHMRQVVTKSELFGDDVEVVVGSPEDILKDRADLSEGSSPSTEEDLSEFSMDSGAEKVSDNEHRQSSDSPRTPVPNRSTTPTGSPPGTMKKWTPSRNPLARRSTLNPMPSRDLLNELTMFDRQPKIEEGSEKVDISTQTTEATDGHESHDQGVQVELLDLETTRGLCTECGSTVDIIYLLSSKVAEASAVLSTPEDQEDNLSTPESFKPDSAAPSMVSETQASTIPQSIVDQPLFENEELDREIESSKVASSEPQANESRAGTCTLEMNSDVLEVPVAAELEENRQTINTDSLEVQQNEDASANISSAPQTTGEKDLTEHSKGQSPNVSNLPGPSQSTLPFLDAMANVEAESDAEAKRIPTRPLMWTDSPKVRKSIESDRQAFYPSETDLESSQSAEVEDKEVETTPTKERHVAARISAVKPRTSVEKPTLSSPLSRENSLNQSMVDSELDDSDIPDHALHRISPRISAVKSRPSQDIIRAAMDKYGSPLKSSGTGTDIESEEDPVAIQFSEVATQVSGNSDSEAHYPQRNGHVLLLNHRLQLHCR